MQLGGFEQQLVVRLLRHIAASISRWRSEPVAHRLLVTRQLASSSLCLHSLHRLLLEDLLLCRRDYLLWLQRWLFIYPPFYSLT
jgi:hypothetical protein